MNRVLVIGGSGFVGRRLVASLILSGSKVFVCDLAPCVSRSCTFIKADMTKYDEILLAFQESKPDLVINLASWGMSGSPMIQQKCYDINIQGTKNILQACRETGIRCLIHTSTYNVVFGGDVIANGDESMPYYPLEQHSDFYSPSKAVSEKLVLEANGSTVQSSMTSSPTSSTSSSSSDESSFPSLSPPPILLTSVIRPAAIYGEGEERHFPRIEEMMRRGFYGFRIGGKHQGDTTVGEGGKEKKDEKEKGEKVLVSGVSAHGCAVVDWVHVDNLVKAYLLLGKKLLYTLHSLSSPLPLPLSLPLSPPCGQAYFISDDSPVDSFSFLAPLSLALSPDPPLPSLLLPFPLMLSLGWMCEFIFKYTLFLSTLFPFLPFLPLPPFLTRSEVKKVAVTHYFSMDKARREIGYSPDFSSEEGMRRVGEWARRERRVHSINHDYFRFATPLMYCLVLLGMGLVYSISLLSDPCLNPILLSPPTSLPFPPSVLFLAQPIYPSLPFSSSPPSLSLTLQSLYSSLSSSSSSSLFQYNLICPLPSSPPPSPSLSLSLLSLYHCTEALGYFLFRSRPALLLLFLWACTMHLGESLYALYIAWGIGCRHSLPFWFIQTLLLGFPSLTLLQQRQQWIQKVEKELKSNEV